MNWKGLSVLVLGACGGASAPPAQGVSPITIATPAKQAAAACITPPDTETVITRASGDPTRLRWCVGAGTDQCFGWSFASATLERLPTAPPAHESSSARVETTNPKLEVCTGEACKTLTPTILPGLAALRATTNDDGTVAVVLLGDPTAGKGYAEVWDVLKGKRTASFKYARGEFRCGEVAMTGGSIYVSAATCGAPAARGALYSLKGKKIANVGGKDFGTYGNAFALVEGTTWGFLEENGNRLAIQDVAKGKVIKTIDVSALWSRDGETNKDAMGNPGESALVRLGDGKLAVIAGAPSTGRIGTVDVASGTVTVAKAPLCGGS